MVTTTAKQLPNQSDGAPQHNQINDKKDTTNSIGTLNNSGHSKIPVLNPNTRSMKCASWAGNDLPISQDMNDLTPGNEKFVIMSKQNLTLIRLKMKCLFLV